MAKNGHTGYPITYLKEGHAKLPWNSSNLFRFHAIPLYNMTRAIPLYNMTTSTYDWSNAWSTSELTAFEDIKQAVIESCSLHYPDDSKTLIIETDASDYGWGSVLYQVGATK